jgi:hypothetical protein
LLTLIADVNAGAGAETKEIAVVIDLASTKALWKMSWNDPVHCACVALI